MAGPSRLQTVSLPGASPDESAATASPARGREMRQNLLSKLRAPPLVHSWDFWHDRQDRKPPSSQSGDKQRQSTPSPGRYEDRLVLLNSISDVKSFWSTLNNFDITGLPLRDSIHLFHKGVKPVWEDPRNARGGSWTFRVPKDKAPEFWKEICMMAIGEQLQEAVASNRMTFIDDICGVSLSVRFTSILVQVWNRDADHKSGVDGILTTVMESLSEQLRPKESAIYYKKHAEHAGFKPPVLSEVPTPPTNATMPNFFSTPPTRTKINTEGETYMPPRYGKPQTLLQEEHAQQSRAEPGGDRGMSAVGASVQGPEEMDDSLKAMKDAMDKVA